MGVQKLITLGSRVSFFIAIIAIEMLAVTSKSIPALDSIWDKGKHCFAFFVLSVLFSFAFSKLHLIKIQTTLLFLYGVQIEVLQFFLPDRFSSLWDIAANSSGILLGLIVIKLWSYCFVGKMSK